MKRAGKKADNGKNRKKLRVRYTTFPTRFGEYFVAASDKGICKLHWPTSSALMRHVEEHFGCELVRDDGHFMDIRRQLKEYMEGELKEFDCRLDFARGTPFQRKCWNALLRIPYGQTRSYQWVAEQAGSPKAFRAAGQANHNNPVPIIVPCHRVIGKDGGMVGYGGPSKEGQKRKRELLVMEGALKPKEGKITRYAENRKRTGKQGRLADF
jgi:O-6-methylguanine DNA methyltransferase